MQILRRSRVQWFVVVVAVLQRHGNSAFGKWTVLLSCLAGATVREKGISRTDIRMGCIIGVSDRMRGERGRQGRKRITRRLRIILVEPLNDSGGRPCAIVPLLPVAAWEKNAREFCSTLANGCCDCADFDD